MPKITNRLEEIKYWNQKKREYAIKASKKQKVTPILKRKQYKIKKTPIRKKSKKQASREYQYHRLIKELKKKPENKICQAGFPGCTKVATECHHAKGRVGKYLLMVKWFRFLCHSCHVYAELNPIEAKEKGISFSRLGTE